MFTHNSLSSLLTQPFRERAGGSWTEDSDSDDEEELTDEEMAEAVAEVAKITNSYSNLQRFHCNGDGLIHKFTNFEVSMLS